MRRSRGRPHFGFSAIVIFFLMSYCRIPGSICGTCNLRIVVAVVEGREEGMYIVVNWKGRDVPLSSPTFDDLLIKCEKLAECTEERAVALVNENGTQFDAAAFARISGQQPFVRLGMKVIPRCAAATLPATKPTEMTAPQSTKEPGSHRVPPVAVLLPEAPSLPVPPPVPAPVPALEAPLPSLAPDEKPAGRTPPISANVKDVVAPSQISRLSAPSAEPYFPVKIDDSAIEVPRIQPELEKITAADVSRCPTFAALRLEILSRLACGTKINVKSVGFLHFIRSDTRELIITGQQYDTFRSVLESRPVCSANAVVMEWRWDNEPASQQALDVLPLAQRQPPPSAVTGSSVSLESSSSVSTVRSLSCRVRGQIRVVEQSRGVFATIPFDTSYPPSYWMLLQHVSHVTAVPTSRLEINLVCDGAAHLLAVQSDFDVDAICALINRGDEPVLFAVDLRC